MARRKKATPGVNKRGFAKRLRSSLTPAEEVLWAELRAGNGGAPFRSQHVICGYVADFYCARARLVVEVDGAYHCGAERVVSDRMRSGHMAAEGIRTIRFWNGDVTRRPGEVLAIIQTVVHRRIRMDELERQRDAEMGVCRLRVPRRRAADQ